MSRYPRFLWTAILLTLSGGGGRSLYTFRKSAFDEAGSSEHHFMVVEIAGDQMFFEAISTDGKGTISQASATQDCTTAATRCTDLSGTTTATPTTGTTSGTASGLE